MLCTDTRNFHEHGAPKKLSALPKCMLALAGAVLVVSAALWMIFYLIPSREIYKVDHIEVCRQDGSVFTLAIEPDKCSYRCGSLIWKGASRGQAVMKDGECCGLTMNGYGGIVFSLDKYGGYYIMKE